MENFLGTGSAHLHNLLFLSNDALAYESSWESFLCLGWYPKAGCFEEWNMTLAPERSTLPEGVP